MSLPGVDAEQHRSDLYAPLALVGALIVSMLPAAAAQVEIRDGTRHGENCEFVTRLFGTVAEIIDGDTLILTDGRSVRLAGIEAPKLYLAKVGADIGATARSARDALEGFASGAKIEIRLGEIARDRHDRMLAQIYLEDGSWLQQAMVDGGFARVRAFAGDFSCLGDLVAREDTARDNGIGLWQSAEYSVISAYDPSLIERKGLYVIVEGRIVSVGRGNRVDFLNFGRHWRSDFTVLVGASVAGRFADRGLSIEGLAEQRVRVRGVIEESGGPAIRLTDPGEIEVLGDD